jgi:hypothetical protein
MSPGLRLYGAEYVDGSTALVFRIALGEVSRAGRTWGTHFGVQRDRLLIQADDGFSGIERSFVRRQHVFHLGNVLLVQFRDAPAFFPATA